MGTFVSIYIIIGLIFLVWMNHRRPFIEYLHERGKGDMGLIEFTFSCLVLLVICASAWPLLVYTGVKNLMKGEK